jgi:hypothetical protein
MDLANMRQNGVRSLEVQRNQCRHRVIVNGICPAISQCRRSARAWCAPDAASAPLLEDAAQETSEPAQQAESARCLHQGE